MKKYKAPLLFAILAIPVLIACHPEGHNNLEPTNLSTKISNIHATDTKTTIQNVTEPVNVDERD